MAMGLTSQLLLSLFISTLLLLLPSSLSQSNQFCDAGTSSKLLIKGGTVVNAHHQQVADVYVEDGIIVAINPTITVSFTLLSTTTFSFCSFLLSNFIGISQVGDEVTVIDATGKFVMPGGIDPHTHLEFEFMDTETVDDFFSGQAAALAGGTTMHIDFVIPHKGSLTAGFEAYEKKAKKSCMDYGFHMAITKWDETVSREMELMVKEKGINSFKFFMAYKGALMINDELLLEGFKKCKSLGALAMVHAENGDAVYEGQEKMIELGITGPEGHALSRPAVLEGEATARAIRLADFVNTPLYVVHVMSIDAMEEIAKARKSGQRVIGEPVASGLALDESWLWHPDFETAAKYVMSPPIRKRGHDKALQAALSTGVLQLVGTDHCAFNSTQKALGIDDFRKIPNGVNGIEERMHLVWDIMVESGQISVTDYVRLTSTECARIFNIYPRKGAILPGSDADIIILNPNSTFEITAKSHHSKLDTNVYEGRSGKGKIEVTIAGGRVVWENNELKVAPGTGRYIKMPPFSYLFNGIDKKDAFYLNSLQAPVKRAKSNT
ncbi:dihydropyrimidinase isoform X1 [Glycine max]|uniref:dihydropyrimidinase isoform X1 n=1 Tax=Glycine max TaxID=3847 RepID=UPI001B356026|nr:dihydropyrimidinase isoform X1 [Glycine max]